MSAEAERPDWAALEAAADTSLHAQLVDLLTAVLTLADTEATDRLIAGAERDKFMERVDDCRAACFDVLVLYRGVLLASGLLEGEKP